MKQPHDRGEGDMGVMVMLFFVIMAVLAVGNVIEGVGSDIKRIADAYCVEAPSATPAEETHCEMAP